MILYCRLGHKYTLYYIGDLFKLFMHPVSSRISLYLKMYSGDEGGGVAALKVNACAPVHSKPTADTLYNMYMYTIII